MTTFLLALRILALALCWIWFCGGLFVVGRLPGFLVLLLILAWPFAWWKHSLWTTWGTLGVFFLMLVVVFGFLKPGRARDWADPYTTLPEVEIDEVSGKVRVRGMRDFVWRTREDYDVRRVDREFDLSQLNALDLVLEPLGDSDHFAHAMLSFGIGMERVVVSVEARREKGESFGLLPGLYRQFEMIYQISTEHDAFTWRTVNAESHLYVIPIATEPSFLKGLFLDMMSEARDLTKTPQFYHSLRSNCTTKLFDHMNQRLPKPVRYGKEVLFPAQAPRLLQRSGWVDGEAIWPEGKERFRRAEQVRKFAGESNFSELIRS